MPRNSILSGKVEHLEALERRLAPSVGGGFTSGGLHGDYYATNDLSGPIEFSRQDVRIDFDWGSGAPGGSTSPGFCDVGADNFSVRWTGQLIPRFSESYTFKTTADDGIRVWIKPASSSTWTTLIDNWPSGGEPPTDRTSSPYALTAGATYDIKVEYHELGGGAVARVHWSSPSTPEETIESLGVAGINAVTYAGVTYADAMKTGRDEWASASYTNNYGPRAARDANGWPMADATNIVWEGRPPISVAGTYLLQFTGKATVQEWGAGPFLVGVTNYGSTLPSGVGYDPTTNTTTATMTVPDSNPGIFYLTFLDSQRTAASPTNTGVTNVKLMRPTSPGASTSYSPGTLFDTSIKGGYSRFIVERWLTANFDTTQVNWSDRYQPNYSNAIPNAFAADQKACWEYLVMLANETGKDLYITIPINASADYVTKLANLIRYGSDGVNPYTSPQSSPIYPGLNPNLRIYVEWSNETWNWAFSQAGAGANASRQAVQQGTPEGQIINFDGNASGGDWRRWAALKTVEASNAFRAVFGNAAMGDRVRMVLEYQYDNLQDTAGTALRFIDDYFNNGDSQAHVATPHPVSYYLWGAGGAVYYSAVNPTGSQSTITVPNAGFETPSITNGTASVVPSGATWSFTGNAGVYRNTAGATIVNLGTPPNAPEGTQAAFIGDTGSMSTTINFTATGVFALQLTAANTPNPNAIRLYVDGVEITPNGSDYQPRNGPWTPGLYVRGHDSRVYSVFGTAPFTISTTGNHTLRIVGTGKAGQYTFLDSVKVTSLDAIFDSSIPKLASYQAQLDSQAKYVQAYGLHVVAYEGGWALGGDDGGSPLQNYGKYVDPRAQRVNVDAIDAFTKSGGALYGFGTYAQWPVYGAPDTSSYPLPQGVDARGATLPAEPTNGIPVPGTLTVSNQTWNYNANGSTLNTNGWFDWNVIVPATGAYNISVTTSTGGNVRLAVDDATTVATGTSGSPRSGTVTLTRGLHTIKVKATGGSFNVTGVTVAASGKQAPTVVMPATASSNPVTGTTTNLSVLGADAGGEANLTYTWSVTSKPSGASAPTYSANGTNASKSTTATFSQAGTYTFLVTISDGSLNTTSSVAVTVNQTATRVTTTPVDLGGSFNRTGIVSDGATFSGGLDGLSNALSANLLGTSQTWNGTPFSFGAPGSSNVVSAAGQTISLPAGPYASLQFLAAAVNGNQPNQPFTVTYADGTTTTFTQSISDWYTPQDYSGESTAVTMSYRDRGDGTKDSRTFYVYGYSFRLDATKAVSRITLPNNVNVELLSATLSPAAALSPASVTLNNSGTQ